MGLCLFSQVLTPSFTALTGLSGPCQDPAALFLDFFLFHCNTALDWQQHVTPVLGWVWPQEYRMDRMHGRFNMMDTPSLLFRSGLSPLSFSILSFLFLSNSLKMVRSSCNVGLAPTKSVTWLLMHIAHVCGQALQYKLTIEGGMERRTTNPNMRKRRKKKKEEYFVTC